MQCFNSKLVRLKAIPDEFVVAVAETSFNSKLVRLKAGNS